MTVFSSYLTPELTQVNCHGWLVPMKCFVRRCMKLSTMTAVVSQLFVRRSHDWMLP